MLALARVGLDGTCAFVLGEHRHEDVSVFILELVVDVVVMLELVVDCVLRRAHVAWR